jgi:hypothetical protein
MKIHSNGKLELTVLQYNKQNYTGSLLKPLIDYSRLASILHLLEPPLVLLFVCTCL